MRKTAILAAAMVVMGTMVFAQTAPGVGGGEQRTHSVSISLSGRVEPFVRLTTTVEEITNLNLYEDMVDLELATINEWSNVRSGYTVRLASANSARLVNGVGHDDPDMHLPYTLSYGGVAVNGLSDGEVVVTNADGRSVGMGTDRALLISYTANMSLLDGTYSDDLTFTITAK